MLGRNRRHLTGNVVLVKQLMGRDYEWSHRYAAFRPRMDMKMNMVINNPSSVQCFGMYHGMTMNAYIQRRDVL